MVEERRQGILGKKKKQEEAMKARIVNIRKIRRAAAAENVESRRRRDIKAREVEVAKKKVRDAGNVKLADKLEKCTCTNAFEAVGLQHHRVGGCSPRGSRPPGSLMMDW